MTVNRSKPDQYQLRFPPGLRDKLKVAADRNSRSMNAEIVARLVETFENDDVMESPSAAAEALKPILDMAKADLAERYEERIGAVEKLLSEISDHIEKGNLTDADKRELEGSIAKRRSKKRED